MPRQLADVDGGPARRRQHQRAQRLGVPLALEGAPERERAGERDRDPEDPRRRVLERPPLLHERERRTPARTTTAKKSVV